MSRRYRPGSEPVALIDLLDAHRQRLRQGFLRLVVIDGLNVERQRLVAENVFNGVEQFPFPGLPARE